MEEIGQSRNGRKARPVEGEARDRGGAEGQSLPKMCLGAPKRDDAMTLSTRITWTPSRQGFTKHPWVGCVGERMDG